MLVKTKTQNKELYIPIYIEQNFIETHILQYTINILYVVQNPLTTIMKNKQITDNNAS